MAVHVQMSPAASGAAFGELDVLLLGVGERPDFIALDGLRRDVTDLFIVEGGTDLAGINQQLCDGIDRNPAHAGDRTHRRPLDQHGEDLDALFQWELVHAPHDMNFFA